MKKQYIIPQTEIVELNEEQQILAGSAPGLGGDYNDGDPVLAPSFDDSPELFFDEE